MSEEWRPVQEFPRYQVSDLANVYDENLERSVTPTLGAQGFLVVRFRQPADPKQYLRQLNKVVAEAFCDKMYSDENSIWHIDGDIHNCQADNLRWELRHKVLEWNKMHRDARPKYATPRVRNNNSGQVYENAFEAALASGVTESHILWRIERHPGGPYDESNQFMYLV